MALQVTASIYGVNTTAIGTSAGTPMTFPTQGLRLEPASLTLGDNNTFNGVTVATCIQLLPTGLNTNERRYYSAAALATIATACNA